MFKIQKIKNKVNSQLNTCRNQQATQCFRKISERPGWTKTILVLGLAMLGWVLLYTGTAFLPAVINPQLPAIVMLIIGAAALLGRHFLQKKYNILNAMTPKQ